MQKPQHSCSTSEMHRIVHFDFKGAPLAMPFLEKLFITIKAWGATGVLLEWEDTFPYVAELVDIGSQHSPSGSGGDGMYSMQEVQHIFQFVKEIGLEAIQLTQTMGHLEFVLKHPAFRGLRELAQSPAVLCPSRQDSQGLIRAMLLQILDAQPDAKYIHIGADEVWHLGICEYCKKRAETLKHGNAGLFLDHIQSLADFIKQKRPGITILMWDDMIRGAGPETILDYKLNQLVEPVLWHYNPKSSFQINPMLWIFYSSVFPRVWGASAFKGANGNAQLVTIVEHYQSNNEAWREEVGKVGCYANFGGIILTGWSRYDHYATLCELMVVSLDSLSACLQVLNTPYNPTELVSREPLPSAEWAGPAARSICGFVNLKNRAHDFVHSQLITAWLNPWQLRNNFTSPLQMQRIVTTAQQLVNELAAKETELSTHLHSVTGKRSTTEIIQTHLRPILLRVAEIRDTAAERANSDAGVFAVQ